MVLNLEYAVNLFSKHLSLKSILFLNNLVITIGMRELNPKCHIHTKMCQLVELQNS